MTHYVILGKWTEQGIKNVKDAPKRVEDTHKAIEYRGGKMTLFYTFGEYDFIMFVEMPNDEAMMKSLLWLDSLGNVRTKTLKAWTELEGAKVIHELTNDWDERYWQTEDTQKSM